MRNTTKMMIFSLLAALLVFGPAGYSYSNPLPKAQGQVQLAAQERKTTEVEVYRNNSATNDEKRMVRLCNDLEADSAQAERSKRTDVEIYRKDTGPGTTEYRREYRESSRFADPADEGKTLRLCRQMEDSTGPAEPSRSEIRVYRETTVPAEHDHSLSGWWHRHIHSEHDSE